MSAVLLAVFNDYETAERVRIDLFRDGFPTDRVELTACCEPGRAGLAPADSAHGKFAQYFHTLFRHADEWHYAESLAERIDNGAAAIAVHPRGAVEVDRATEILKGAGPLEVAEHDLANQAMEHAAAKRDRLWVRNFWSPSHGGPDCIYCRLFERGSN